MLWGIGESWHSEGQVRIGGGCGQGNNLSLFSSQELPQAQPPGDSPILEVEEIEKVPVTEPPQASVPLDSGYEKHFLPTPEELGLLGPTPGSRLWPETTPGGERGTHLT